MRVGMLLLIGFLALMVGWAMAGDEPAPKSDPAIEIIEKLLSEMKKSPAEPPSTPSAKAPALLNPIPEPTSETDDIIDGLAKEGEQAEAVQRAKAVGLIEQSRAALQKGDRSEAIRLLGAARRLDPTNEDIEKLLESLHKASPAKAAHPGYSKGKAHLASALTRAQSLMGDGNYRESEDLLRGIIRAVDAFPADADVSLYRRLATKELTAYQSAVKEGRISPEEPSLEAKEPEPVLVATGSAAPLNARRILRSVESATPEWYSRAKTRLAFPMTVDYSRSPAGVVFEDITKLTGLKMYVDDPVMQSRAHLNTNIDLRVSGVSAESVLNLACEASGLEYVIMERGIIVTTPARAVRYLQDSPASVRQQWAAARVLFPEMTPELLASPPLPNALPGQSPANSVGEVPSYLSSGDALVADIKAILTQGSGK